MAETVLVTGGTGFIGGWCIALLLKDGHKVRTTVRSLAKGDAVRAAVSPQADTASLSFAAADLTKDEGWDEAMAGVDYVLHVASPLGGGADLLTPARDGTLRVLKAAVKAGVKRVVMTSAAATARPPRESGKVSDETIWADPNDPQFDAYRQSKIHAERAAWDFMKAHGGKTEFTTVLPGAVYGPPLSKDNWGSVQLINRILQGQPPGVMRFSFFITDVRDLAALHLAAMKSPAAAGERFIGAGEFMWMRDVAKVLRDGLGERAAKVPKSETPDIVIKTAAMANPQLKFFANDLGRKFELSNEKAKRVLGFAPRPAAETILDTAEALLAD